MTPEAQNEAIYNLIKSRREFMVLHDTRYTDSKDAIRIAQTYLTDWEWKLYVDHLLRLTKSGAPYDPEWVTLLGATANIHAKALLLTWNLWTDEH
jgi:hypothetical protein